METVVEEFYGLGLKVKEKRGFLPSFLLIMYIIMKGNNFGVAQYVYSTREKTFKFHYLYESSNYRSCKCFVDNNYSYCGSLAPSKRDV